MLEAKLGIDMADLAWIFNPEVEPPPRAMFVTCAGNTDVHPEHPVAKIEVTQYQWDDQRGAWRLGEPRIVSSWRKIDKAPKTLMVQNQPIPLQTGSDGYCPSCLNAAMQSIQ